MDHNDSGTDVTLYSGTILAPYFKMHHEIYPHVGGDALACQHVNIEMVFGWSNSVIRSVACRVLPTEE